MDGFWNVKVTYVTGGVNRTRNYTVFGPMLMHAIERCMEDFPTEDRDMQMFRKVECEKMVNTGNIIQVKDTASRT